MDSVSKDKRSAIMRLVKSKDTNLETAFRRLLWRSGLRYRKNNNFLFGKPDIAIKSKKLVIFIDSCYWHGCKEHLRLPKSNADYWIKKIDRNKKRDELVNEHYRNKKWTVLRFWEHDLKKAPESAVKLALKVL